MTYTERHLKVLKEFCILDDKGEEIEVRLLRPEDKPLGLGPKVDPKVVAKLIQADTTVGQVWLEWIFHQAAGGNTAKEASERALEQMKQRFLDERLHGYQHARTREIYPKISKEDAELRWAETEPRFKEVLFHADQDSVEKLGVWGFYRHWPGKDSIYMKVETAVKKWLVLRPKVETMNNEIAAEGKDRMTFGPDGIDNVEALELLIRKVERYFASKKARVDVRLAKWKGNDFIYEDDFIVALAPITYAASVRYGCDAWQWASREIFERVLLDEQSFADAWKSQTERGSFYAYLRFKCPVPRWIARKNDQFFIHELTNLAVELGRTTAKGINNLETLTFHDEEGRTTHYSNICKMIHHEVHRPPEEENDMPIKRGNNVYANDHEAADVIHHLECALVEITRWAKEFDPAVIVTDAMATLSAESRGELPS